MLFLVFIIFLGVSEVTSTDRNVQLESLHSDDRIEEMKNEMTLMKSDMDSVKTDVNILKMNVMAVLNELKAIKDFVGINLNDGEVLSDPLENRNIGLDQRLKTLESEMSTLNVNIGDK